MAVDSASSASLAPGFRFHPTDEELVRYYLRRKVCGKPFRFDAISDVDIYKVEPWDLPGLSRLKTRDLEWYFFSCLDKKYGNGSRTNRATEKGYWKTTGKDRAVNHKSQAVGMKKTLVYHCGRAPRGERTNWVMHEYRLIDQELEKAGIVQDAFVLCRIFRKSGSGPKNGEQYGAPFIEEEWEDDELVVVPKEESAGEVAIDDYDAGLDANDIAQILNTDSPAEGAPLPLNYHHEDNNGNFGEVNTHMTSDPDQQFLVGAGENEHWDGQNDGQQLFDLPSDEGMFAKPVKHEYIGEPSNDMNSLEYLLDEQYLDASSDLLLDDGLFLGADGLGFFEANDLNEAIESDTGRAMVDEYINDYPTTDNLQYTFDSSVGSESLVPGSSSIGHEYADEEAQQETAASQELLEGQAKNDASSSKQGPEFGKGTLYPSFFEKATNMLEKFSAPPAYASEFPTKDAALHLARASSSSVHVTAGMIQLRNVSFSGAGVDWSLGKHGQVNIVLSFGLAQTDGNPTDSQLTGNTGKVDSTMSRSWFYSILLCILVLSMSCKIGTYICPRSFMS